MPLRGDDGHGSLLDRRVLAQVFPACGVIGLTISTGVRPEARRSTSTGGSGSSPARWSPSGAGSSYAARAFWSVAFASCSSGPSPVGAPGYRGPTAWARSVRGRPRSRQISRREGRATIRFASTSDDILAFEPGVEWDIQSPRPAVGRCFGRGVVPMRVAGAGLVAITTQL